MAVRDGRTRRFQFADGSLEARLAFIFPALAGTDFAVATTDLHGNAWNTLSVRHHRVAFRGTTVECIEKKLGKVFGVGAYESLIHARLSFLEPAERLGHARYLGRIETPTACFLYTEVVTGPRPNLTRAAAEAARGIAEMELLSAAHLRSLAAPDRFTYWRMDFFRPWSLWRPRYNPWLARYGRQLRGASQLAAVGQIAGELQPLLALFARQARKSPPCLSHLDLLSKNFIQTGHRLHLIDWGEARIGRLGFDAGSYLHRLLRDNELPAFRKTQQLFLTTYLAELPASVDPGQVRRNAAFFLALRSLCYFLREDVLREHLAAPEPIEQKLAYLAAELKQLVALP
jgi:hypothetical protein